MTHPLTPKTVKALVVYQRIPPTKQPDRIQNGFTLIELSVVMALMGLIMAVAVVSFQGPYRQARSKYALERLAHYEHQARRYAARTGRPLTLEIDLDESKLSLQSPGGSQVQLTPLLTGNGLRIEQVLCATSAGPKEQMSIPVSSRGRTPSYALKVHLANGADAWLMFAGVTGQGTQLENENEVRLLLQQDLPIAGPNAD